MRRIPIADPQVGTAAIERVEQLLQRGDLAAGEEVARFEREFADFCGVEHAVATTNGTTALHAALEAIDVGRGDAVVTSPFSFVATANAIKLAGATPVFADIDLETYTLDPASTRAILKRRDDVACLLPVHLYGLPARMDELGALASDYGVPVVTDACQAHGASLAGERVGSLGDVGCFSFYPTKNMTTMEGGMVTTDRPDIARRVRSFRNHGRPPDGPTAYHHESVGHNFRLTDPAGAIGRSQLERLPEWNSIRRRTATHYNDSFADLPVELPVEPPDCRHVYHQYTLRTDDREHLRSTLEAAGIETGVYYPRPLTELAPFRHCGGADLTAAAVAAQTVCSLPVHPGLEDEDRRTIVTAVQDHYGS